LFRHDSYLKRNFNKDGKNYFLSVESPEKEEENVWWTRVSLQSPDKLIWSHRIGGIDGIQSALLALQFARELLESDGGFKFLGHDDLQLP
jgi:hypothetical protein